jgi:RNase P/RNase MRP subunit POP5
MLKRRPKRRYLSVAQDSESADLANIIKKRFCELFGTIATERAAIAVVEQRENEFITIIKCNLEKLDEVLVAIALIDPPAVTVAMSGSIKQLRNRTKNSL